MDINTIKSPYINSIANYYVLGNVLGTLHVLTHLTLLEDWCYYYPHFLDEI